MKTSTVDKLIVKEYETRSEMGKGAAKEVAAKFKTLLEKQPSLSVIFASAPSQKDFFEEIVNYTDIDRTRINAFHMDEYIGIDLDAPQAFRQFLKDHLFSKLPFGTINYLDNANPSADCKLYADLLGNVDVVVLGIGENGHLAFNDPGVAFFDDPEMVKIVELDLECRQQQVNDGCFLTLDDVPTHAITLTIPALFSGKSIFAIVPGGRKADAVAKTLLGPVDESCPASILRRHDQAVLYLDKDSAAKYNLFI